MEGSKRKTVCSAEFGSSVDKVWGIVTNHVVYGWRSDLSKCEVRSGGRFTEYSKKGFPTEFTVTLKIPYERYEFDMVNDNLTGHWTGIFEKVNGRTKVTFTEEVEVKNGLLRLLSGIYLKKQQKTYIEDLRKALEQQ